MIFRRTFALVSSDYPNLQLRTSKLKQNGGKNIFSVTQDF